MARLKYLVFLILLVFTINNKAQSPDWNGVIIIPPNPSPYYSDWETNPSNLTFLLQYLGGGSVDVILKFAIESEKLGKEIASGSSEKIEFDGAPEQKNLYGSSLIDWNGTTWDHSIESIIIRTGRFPEGRYTICIGAYDPEDNLLTENCAEFKIAYIDPPYLISPLDGDTTFTQYPNFIWSPIVDNFSNQTIYYALRISEKKKNQTNEQAIADNIPYFEGKTELTTLSYPPTAQEFEKNKTYVWQIKALDKNDYPVASNNGNSAVWAFTYANQTVSTPMTMNVKFLTDSVTLTEDQPNETINVEVSFQAPLDKVIAVDSLIDYWYETEGGKIIGSDSSIVQNPFSLLGGETTTISQKFSVPEIAISEMLNGKERAEYYVHREYIGKGEYKKRIVGKSKTPLKVIVKKVTPEITLEFLTKDITITPNNLSDSVSIQVSVKGDSSVIVDSKINYWYKKSDNSLLKKIVTQIDPTIEIPVGTHTRKSEISFPPSSLAEALKGKKKSEYYAFVEYSGKDKNGKRITGKTKTSLAVTFLAYDLFNVEFVDSTITFSPDSLHKIIRTEMLYQAAAGENLTVDSLYGFWYRKDDNSLFKKTEQFLTPKTYLSGGVKKIHGMDLTLPVSSITTALAGKKKAEYLVKFKFVGKDSFGNRIIGETKDMLKTVVLAGNKPLLTIKFLDSTLTYSPTHLSNIVRDEVYYIGGANEKVTFDSLVNYWYKKEDNSLYKVISEELPNHPYVMGGKTYAHNSTFTFPASSITTALGGKNRAEYYVKLKYIVRDDNGNRIEFESKDPLNIVFRASTEPGLNVEFSDSSITYTPTHLKNDENLYLFYQAASGEKITIDSLSTSWYKKQDSSLYKVLPSPITPTFEINGGCTYTRTARLNLSSASLNTALDGKKKAEYLAYIEYFGKEKDGKRISGKTKIPLTVVCLASDVTDTTDYQLIPKVAYVKPIQGQTTINASGSKVTFNGTVKLLFSVDPLKKDSAYVNAVNLTFQKGKTGYEVTGGTFFGEATPKVEDDIFNFKFGGVLKVQAQRISFDFKRTNRLLIKDAFAKIPVIGRKLFFKDLVIDKNGLDLKISKQEFHAFWLVFIVKNLKKVSNSTVSKISLGVGLRLDKPGSQEFFSSELLITKVSGGETTVELKEGGGNGHALIHLIPTTNYLNLTSLRFKKKPNGDWALRVGVESDNLPLYEKLGLGPIQTTFEFSKSGKMSGGIAVINETHHGYDNNDKSVFKIGSFAAVDLTYLGFEIEQVQKITTVDSKPDTSWTFDFSKSKIGISADLYLSSEGKNLNDPSNAIYIGEVNNPGVVIDFSGNVKTQTITISKKKRVSLGPVYLELTKLGIKPYPFNLSFSGSFGVAMKDVFSGGISIEGLAVDGGGNFTNFGDAVKGGNLSILKVLELNVEKIAFSKTSSPISYAKNTGSKSENSSTQVDSCSIDVDSYFLLEGITLKVGSSDAAGGSLKRLLIYEKSGATNFILNECKLSVKDVINLTIDVEYINNPNEKYLSVGGKAVVLDTYEATLYGKIGERDGDATWGFFVALSGVNIPLGPVTLNDIGGGFFYRPTKADIRKVTILAGFTQIKLSGYETRAKPNGKGSQAWAIFLKAGIYVGGKEFIYGKALVTITDSYFKLDAEVKAIKGQAHGKAYLNINWEKGKEYVEGKFQFGVDFVVIKAEEKDNYLQFYAYNKSTWGVTGKLDLRSFFIKVTADVYVGNQGFLFDLGFEESFDVAAMSGGFRIEAMTWWKKDVNWGIYASGKAWGELLGGLAGAEIGVEGALISPPFLIYLGGHLKVTLCWVDVFDGRAWITISEDGLDGGTGGNAKFDKLIKDARNVGNQMKKDMDEMNKKLKAARDALYKLSQAQRIAAGNAMMMLSGWSGGDELDAFFGKIYKKWHRYDLNCKLFPYEQITADSGEANITKVFNLIWNSKASNLYQIKKQLDADSAAIASVISEIQSLESGLTSLLNSRSELIEGELPKLSTLNNLQSPVTKPVLTPTTITVNDTTKTVSHFSYSLDDAHAKNLKRTVVNRKSELEAYQTKLVSMVGNYVSKLNEIKKILYEGGSSVSAIADKYADTYDKISSYTTRLIDYLQVENYWAIQQKNKLTQMQNDVFSDLSVQSIRATSRGTERFNNLCKQRIGLIKDLIRIGAAKNFAPPLENISATNYIDLGKELYYYIPNAGYTTMISKTQTARAKFMREAKANNDLFQAKWNAFTMRSDKVYSRETKLYTILYDLFDQLSVEAGTRKIQSSSSGNLVAGGSSGGSIVGDQIPFVDPSGIVGVSFGGNGSSSGGTSAQFVSIGGGNTQRGGGGTSAQFVSTGGSNTQRGGGNIGKKSEWAKGWDFEAERITVKKILTIPKIINFSGSAYSDKNTPNYSKVTLSWSGEHPIGIAEYSFAIEGYSDAVQVGTGGTSSGNSGTHVFGGQLNTSPIFGQTNCRFFGGENDDDNSISMQTGGGLDDFDYTGTFSQGGAQPAWRSAGKKQTLTFPFLRGIHKEGDYNIWIRVRGAGGYTIERRGVISVSYCGSASGGSDFDWSTRSSSLVTIDRTPPSKPVVNDGGPTTSSLNTLLASWSAADYESGIQEYQYKLVYDDGNRNYADFTPWISAGGQEELTIRLDKSFEPGKTYYVLVKAQNGVGMWSETGKSNGITLKDPTPPTAPSFTPPRRRGGTSLPFRVTLNDSLLNANWYPSSDPESGVIGYMFAVGTTDGGTDVISWCAVQSTSLHLENGQLQKILNVKLQKNKTYYFSVKAMNGIGVFGEAISQPVTVN